MTGPNTNYTWHTDVAFWDPLNGWLPSVSPYSGPARANATLTQLRDTNGQLAILGGTVINNNSAVDMVTNFPLANMTDVVLYDPRTQLWEDAVATGQVPPPRKHHTATLHPDGKTIIVFGGEAYNTTSRFCLNDVALLDTDSWVWRIPNTTGTALYRSNHTAIVINNQLWLIAGSNTTNKAVDIQILDLNTWKFTYNYQGASTPFASLGGVKGLVGIIIGLVVAVLLAAGALWWWFRRKNNERRRSEDVDDAVWHETNDLPPMSGDQDRQRLSFREYSMGRRSPTNLAFDQAKYEETTGQYWDNVPPYLEMR
ncbi:Kelch domain-containing protein 2 [Apophysomyces sp. BC1015]|nr:Kelch domain-containing protein 2 [Apophysomyces sp. BC1015]